MLDDGIVVDSPLPDEHLNVDTPVVEDALAATEVDSAPTPEPEETPEQIEENDGEDAAAEPPKKGVQKRIDELTKARREVERERDYYKSLAEKPVISVEPEAEAPKEENFESYGDFVAAVAKHAADVRWKELNESTSRMAIQQEKAQRTNKFNAQIEATKNEYADFDDVVLNSGIPFSDALLDVAERLESGPKVLYNLCKSDPERAKRLNSSDPITVALELGQIQARLNAVPSSKSSSAPPPPKTLQGQSTPEKDPDKMSPAEYRKWRESGKK